MTETAISPPQETPDALIQTDIVPTEAPEEAASPAAEPLSLDDKLEAIAEKLEDSPGEPKEIEATEVVDEEIADKPDETALEPEDTPAIEMPKSWSADRSELWSQISPEAREVIAARETEAHAKISQMGQQIAAFKPVDDLLASAEPIFQRHGIDAQTGVSKLLEAQQWLDADPVSALQAIAQTYGVDLSQQLSGQAPGDENSHIAGLQKQVAQLTSQLNQFQGQAQYIEQERERQAQESVKSEIEKWSADKPFYEDVRRTMGALMGVDPSLTLDEAYQQATDSKPEIRAKIEKQNEAKRLEEKQKIVSEAKRKASVNVGIKPGSPNPPKRKKTSATDGDYLSDVYDQVQSRLAG